MNRFLFLAVLALIPSISQIRAQQSIEITPLPGEYWWGGAVGVGEEMPFTRKFGEYNLAFQSSNNQVVPLLLSNRGRYVWSDMPIRFSVADSGEITVSSDYEKPELTVGGSTLREAFNAACNAHFPPSGLLPDSLFFSSPQYNTWIELMYNQNQDDILKYARSIVENRFPTGVLMIDDNWMNYYGSFSFKSDKFPNPKAMTAELHRLGFKVMLWICPFVSPDSPEYRTLAEKGFLIKSRNGRPAIFNWWNGQSACYDFTNPAAADWFVETLKKFQAEYGIDGFKFDAGDNSFYYSPNLVSYRKDAVSVTHTEAWVRIGLNFPFNEYRAGWRMGGQALVQRLGDKNYSWDAVQSLIPQMVAAGLLGYAYVCPDMIGGGNFVTFLNVDEDKFDQALIVRSAQVHALMPMMQFSVAPWRILSAENLEIVRQAALLHRQFGGYILACARESAKTGEPIVRNMEYAFPGQGFALVNDQFMLGEKYLVAPVVTKDNFRAVKLPKGAWKDDLGKVYKGDRTVKIEVPLNRLPYFEKIK
ncbi:MAG: glycoside hydrolase family 31 protein [Dysgonamonadaceae bacterium]|jgi:alpha-glucosidase|nr:glycoside hydrolase family 31 protein [Dysgonamonadaceae bacterium]